MRNSELNYLEQTFGIHMPLAQDYLSDDLLLALDAAPTYGAQNPLLSVSNAGVPAFLTTYVDPRFTEILVSPVKAVEIIGEIKKGDWTDDTAYFPLVEHTGEVSSYGDYSDNGLVGANVNWEPRQSYHFQTFTQWGEKELAKMGRAKVDWANRLNASSALIMAKFQNKSYFYGISGLANYGLLNDPSLPASITPCTKTGGGNAWSAASLANEVFQDIESLYQQLVLQTNGLVDLNSKVTLSMTPTSQVALTKTTQYGVNVMDMIKKNFPNLRVVTAVEYATTGGNLMQMIADEIEGQEVADAAFTEKMRAHRIIQNDSSYRQKKSAGTWGAVIYMPIGIASMLGI